MYKNYKKSNELLNGKRLFVFVKDADMITDER